MECISCDHPCEDIWHDEYGEALCEHCARALGIEATADDDAVAQ